MLVVVGWLCIAQVSLEPEAAPEPVLPISEDQSIPESSEGFEANTDQAQSLRLSGFRKERDADLRLYFAAQRGNLLWWSLYGLGSLFLGIGTFDGGALFLLGSIGFAVGSFTAGLITHINAATYQEAYQAWVEERPDQNEVSLTDRHLNEIWVNSLWRRYFGGSVIVASGLLMAGGGVALSVFDILASQVFPLLLIYGVVFALGGGAIVTGGIVWIVETLQERNARQEKIQADGLLSTRETRQLSFNLTPTGFMWRW